jgi:hypothetical protein
MGSAARVEFNATSGKTDMPAKLQVAALLVS